MAFTATSPSTSRSLLHQLMDPQSEDAWRRFVHLYTPLIYRWCRTRGCPSSDVADVTQDVFQAVMLGIGRLNERDPQVSFRSWLWRIVHHKTADHYRRTGREVAAREVELAVDQSTAVDEDESFDAESFLLHRALELIHGEFEPATWQAFLRTTIGNERATDIADELQMTKKAVRQAKYRVLRRLRLELAEQIDGLD